MRITEPGIDQEIKRSARRERRRWDDSNREMLALGCRGCAEFGTCGGLHKRQPGFWCMDHCCGFPDTCDSVCPRNPKAFLDRIREIDGFEFDNIPRTDKLHSPLLPAYVPLVYHRSRRNFALRTSVAAIPFHQLYDRGNQSPKYSSRTAVADAFGLDATTTIIAIGSGYDRSIETWWGCGSKRKDILRGLGEAGITFLTSPNYSLFTDAIRYDDMHSMKRIAIAWQESVAQGVPCALHINARTIRDYDRFIEFIRERPEVVNISFEFATGAGWPSRRGFHIQHLARLREMVDRPLHLTIVGGSVSVPILSSVFDGLTYVDSSAFMNAVKRQRLYESNDRSLQKYLDATDRGAPIDNLLQQNIDVMRLRIESRFSRRSNELH